MAATVQRLIVFGLFGAVLVLHLAVAGQDFSVLAKNGFLYDDSFYAFKIAQNIAEGNGATFDGVHATNGFQPLYVFLIAPFYRLFPGDLVAPIVAALILSAVLTALSAVLLFAILRRYTGFPVALGTAALWGLSPIVIRQSANGLETALALFFFAALVYVYLDRIRAVERPRVRDLLLLGALAGLAILARVDEVFIVLVISLDYLLLLRRRRAPARALGRATLVAAAALIVYSPWLVFNAVAVGHMSQDSGKATRFLSLAYAPFFGLGSTDVITSGPDFDFLSRHLAHSFSVLKLSPPIHPLYRGIERIGGSGNLRDVVLPAANVLGLLIIAALVYLVVFGKHRLRVRGFGEVQFLLVFCAVLMAAYSFYIFGVFFFARYYYPVYFVACVFAGLFVQEAVERFRGVPGFARSLAVTAFAGYLGAFALMAYNCAGRSHPMYCFYDAAQWIESNSSPDDTIGVFQSGAVGYFSTRRVINLDGKVNRDALDALRTGRLADYLRKEGIDIVIDNKRVLELFLTGRVGAGGAGDPLVLLGLNPMMGKADADLVPGWAAYRVNGFATRHGAEDARAVPSDHLIQ